MTELRAGSPRAFGRTIVIPIERVGLRLEAGPLGPWFGVTKEPVAVIIRDHHGYRAIDMEAQSRPIDEFIGKIPNLAQLMRQCRTDADQASTPP